MDSFPVTWEYPDDATGTWFLDGVQKPISPLEYTILPANFVAGLQAAAQAYDLQLVAPAFRRINTYLYLTGVQILLPPGSADNQLQGKLGAAVAELESLWTFGMLPEITRSLAEWRAFDLPGCSLAQLREHLDATLATMRRFADLHFRITWPAGLAISEFDDLYRSLFPTSDPFESYRLLQGLPNKTMEMGTVLWELGRQGRRLPAVRHILAEHTGLAILEALQHTSEGRQFLASLEHYLTTYGARGEEYGLRIPSWMEDPQPVLAQLKAYSTLPDTAHPALQTKRLAQERERLIEQARTTLQQGPQDQARQFEQLLAAAQAGSVIREDHEYYLDSSWTYEVRRVLLEYGRRFVAAGIIADSDAIFLLTLQELYETADQYPSIKRQTLVQARQAEMEHWSNIEPPPLLGSAPSDQPTENRLSRSWVKVVGMPVARRATETRLEGLPGSPGRVRGPARILRSLRETARVQPGDILVTPTGSPALTSLFGMVAAIVTDHGGILSHCAAVAREYGIPAVVGTAQATVLIRDGQLVEVDGSTGTVYVFESRGVDAASEPGRNTSH